MGARFGERHGIRHAIANFHFKAVRPAAIVPHSRRHLSVEEIQVDLTISAAALELRHEQIIGHELLPGCFQTLNILCGRGGWTSTARSRSLKRAATVSTWKISVILPPTFTANIERGKVMVPFEGKWSRGRVALGALPMSQPFALTSFKRSERALPRSEASQPLRISASMWHYGPFEHPSLNTSQLIHN
jgi:hypothetical protein